MKDSKDMVPTGEMMIASLYRNKPQYDILRVSHEQGCPPKKEVIFSRRRKNINASSWSMLSWPQGLRLLGRSLMARDEGDGTNPVAERQGILNEKS